MLDFEGDVSYISSNMHVEKHEPCLITMTPLA